MQYELRTLPGGETTLAESKHYGRFGGLRGACSFVSLLDMKTITLLGVAAIFLAFCSQSFAAEGKDGSKVLYHVVSLKFKPEATAEQIKAVEAAFSELKTKVPGVLSLSGGTDVSPEKRSHGFTHCYVLTFASEKDRDAYAVHPAHKAFGKLLGPIMEDVMVVDFWPLQ